MNLKPEIITDGRTVWVNTWCCIGRFGFAGIDIHREPGEAQTKGECLYCTHEPTTRTDWDTFVQKMKELHGVEVPQQFMPDRFKERT